MKLTQMIHQTVLAFKPERQPWFALAALTLLLTALVVIAYLGGSGAGALIKALV